MGAYVIREAKEVGVGGQLKAERTIEVEIRKARRLIDEAFEFRVPEDRVNELAAVEHALRWVLEDGLLRPISFALLGTNVKVRGIHAR